LERRRKPFRRPKGGFSSQEHGREDVQVFCQGSKRFRVRDASRGRALDEGGVGEKSRRRLPGRLKRGREKGPGPVGVEKIETKESLPADRSRAERRAYAFPFA